MGLTFLCAALAAVSVSFVDGVGYMGVRPPSLKQCCYKDIDKAHFSYDNNLCEGPDNWCKVHPCWTTCASKNSQSPININTGLTRYKRYPRLKFEKILRRVLANVRNNGHAPYFEVHDRYDDEITVRNVPERPSQKEYNFAQIHIQLGQDQTNGSEHSIDNVFKPMEAQVVFYDKDYEDVTDAKSKKRGLVVMSVMVEVYGQKPENDACGCDQETCTVRYARRLSALMEKYYEKVRRYPLASINPTFWSFLSLPKKCWYNRCGKTPTKEFIKNRCEKEEPDTRPFRVFEGITPLDVLPYDTNRFYTYSGSLTSPPCYETVQWIVYKCPIKVSAKAFQMLQLVEDSHLKPLPQLGTRRPQQNMNVPVYRSYLK
ncbi:nacrein-like protein [Mytilus trossulus]|uniref:nacrein-like protein n=1 Tax=Mytilus trossulus TaxID=6551 RepID=UPI003004E7A5